MKTRLYLDDRAVKKGLAAPVKLVITFKGVRSLIGLNVSVKPEHWDADRQMVVKNPKRAVLNERLDNLKRDADRILERLEYAGALVGLKSCQVKDLVAAELFPHRAEQEKVAPKDLFLPYFKDFMAQKSEGTFRIYRSTLLRLEEYSGFSDDTTFGDMTVAWLRDFDAWLARTSPSANARGIHFRNIRAVFNDAITEEVISCYPFRKFKIKSTPTRKRALTVDQLRELWSLRVEEHERRYLDCFKLLFLLCGINIVDLCNLKDIVNGRAEYARAKTHKLYDIKLEPETEALIKEYAGDAQILNYLDTCANYRFFYNRLAPALASFGERIGVKGLSTYWARHTWATIASSLDVPKDTIAAALGHGGNTVTDIYIDFDRRKVDEANRKVIDWVLYKKRI